jgi:putative transposase
MAAGSVHYAYEVHIMNDSYIRGRTAVYRVKYHIIWCTEYRKPIITDGMATWLHDALQAIGAEKGFTVQDIAISPDTVTCTVNAPPKLSITQIVKWLKGISGKRLFDKYHVQLWNGSYFAETIGEKCQEAADSYVKNMETHQL